MRALDPRGQSVHRDKVALEFAVGVCEDAAQVRVELNGSSVVRAEEQPPLVVVVRVEVVPDDRLAF